MAADTEIPTQVFQETRDYGSVLAAVTLEAERTSTSMHTEGLNSLALDYRYTYSAATATQVYVDHSVDGVTWSKTAELDTIAERVHEYTTGAASNNFHIVLDIHAKWTRVRVNGTSGAAGDLVTLRARATHINRGL